MKKKEAGALLIIAEDDWLSEEVEVAAKEAHFKGKILKLSKEEGQAQRTPFPLLMMAGKSYGPISVREYFASAKSSK